MPAPGMMQSVWLQPLWERRVGALSALWYDSTTKQTAIHTLLAPGSYASPFKLRVLEAAQLMPLQDQVSASKCLHMEYTDAII